MAKEDPILVDRTELILSASVGGGMEPISVSYDKIIRIEFRKCEETKLFKKFPSEQIVFTVRGREDPVIFYRQKVGEALFDGYKTALQKFAKENRVTFLNSL
jgi:hypothetical protein